MPRLSRRAEQMPASPIRRLVPYADAAQERGIHVHYLNIGQPDIPTPPEMIRAYQRYDETVLAYGPSQGLPEMRAAVAADYVKRGLSISPDQVTTCFGGSEAVTFALAAVADPGDEVVVPEPFYANYAGFATLLGASVKPVAASAQDGFHLPSDEALDAAVGPRTRAFVFCSPGNPTGTVYTPEEMARIGRFAQRHDLMIISDEVYRDFAYDGVKVTSALELPDADDRVIVIDSVSKKYSACGARVGFVVTRSASVLDAVMRMSFARLCPATVDQHAAIAAYQTPDSYFDKVRTEYKLRRDCLVDGLNSIDGVHSYRPEGAFYTVATFPVDDIDRFAVWLLTDFDHNGETVLIAPATGFYATPGLGKDQARIAYVLGVPFLQSSVEILRAGLQAFR
ncbi:MAG: pyridoxal phosphate-dependent aminotransferase [Myxococcota bacterium]